MEDEFFLSADGSFSAVYDGHGGANVSEYLRRNLYKHVSCRRLLLVVSFCSVLAPPPFGMDWKHSMRVVQQFGGFREAQLGYDVRWNLLVNHVL